MKLPLVRELYKQGPHYTHNPANNAVFLRRLVGIRVFVKTDDNTNIKSCGLVLAAF